MCPANPPCELGSERLIGGEVVVSGSINARVPTKPGVFTPFLRRPKAFSPVRYGPRDGSGGQLAAAAVWQHIHLPERMSDRTSTCRGGAAPFPCHLCNT